jgi:hypothetical protein
MNLDPPFTAHPKHHHRKTMRVRNQSGPIPARKGRQINVNPA